jgi:8-oxo-dGTP pyrophosphatase MutT (NUDIX family)
VAFGGGDRGALHAADDIETPGFVENARMDLDRLIPLRRPPRLLVEPGRWVPPATDLDAVDHAFRAAQLENPRLHDGAIWHVLSHARDGHGGITLHVIESAYRFQAVARRAHPDRPGPARPLGVKCLARGPRGWLMGRRSPHSLTYGGCWEFLGGGSLQVGEDPAAAALRELREEAGVVDGSAPVAVAMLLDAHVGTWDIVHRVDIPEGMPGDPASWEHQQVVEEPDPARRRPPSHATTLLLPLVDQRA